jgi:hypothetical protein
MSRRTPFAQVEGLGGTPRPTRGPRALLKGIGLLLLCAAGGLGTGTIHANPFQPVQRLTLGNMNQDGDLFLRVKICSIEITDETSLDVFLEHAMEAEDYAITGSWFHLRPFETSVWEREGGELIWEKPSGGIAVARVPDDAEPKSPSPVRMNGFPSRFPKFARQKNVTAEWNETGDAWVNSEGWRLGYKNGGLSVIHSSGNKFLTAKAAGSKVTELRAGRQVLAAIEWRGSGNPAALRCGEDRYVFAEDEQGRMTRVIDEGIGAAIIEFSYNKDGLIEQVKRIGTGDMTVSWKANKGYGRGDSFYKKPFSVEKIDDTKYGYFRDGNRITMRMKSPGSDWQRLRWELKNGKIISIN